jgi:uncharacterized protein YyaL (SSP411 family)
MKKLSNSKNMLRNESSPYLLQHADNPVHWMPWNEESLALAEQLDKPILLSIGYSACHWCHVMAHESFEDTETAEQMNQRFINIKVDKEERPDLDKIYQNAHSLLTERPGGWPLTVFLTPDTRMPIFAGTYFPKESKHGLPSFKTLMQHISDAWSSRKHDIDKQSTSLQDTYQRIYESSKPATAELNLSPVDIARSQVEKQFDSRYGGFSGAPKFPHPSILDFCITHWGQTKKLEQTPDSRILDCAIFSLEKMADGGLFDHLGGGFCRYSTDELWMIPHFEKMLYDNGPLLSLYSEAWKITGDLLFFDAASETANWVMREMQAADGGYYAAQDADSEGHEGKFFVWQKDELDTLLREPNINNDTNETIQPDSIELFKQRFGLDRPENFEGQWHLHGYLKESELVSKTELSDAALHQQFKLIRQHLFLHREKRIHPGTDTKVLCAWNGLMIHGMSRAGRLLKQTLYIESAYKAACFLKKRCWKDDQLYASYKDGKASLNAYLDDYAFLIYGLLELLQSRWDNDLYDWSLQLADKLLDEFEDADYGGFFFTGHHHENLIQRVKSFSDDAIPSGNAIAVYALNRLGYLSGNTHYIDAAERCLKSAWTSIKHAPVANCALLTALNEFLNPPDTLIIRHQSQSSDDWPTLASQYNLPFSQVFSIAADTEIHPTLKDKSASDSNLAYLCSGTKCYEPMKTTSELESYLGNNSYRV